MHQRTPQTSNPTLLQRITAIRQDISALAGTPTVLSLAASGLYHPDLTLGDAMSALDELSQAVQNFGTVRQRRMVACDQWHLQTALYDAACDGLREAIQTIHARNIPAMQEALYQLGLTTWRYTRNETLADGGGDYYDFHITLPDHLQSPDAVAALWFGPGNAQHMEGISR